MFTKSLEISDTTNLEIFERIFFQSSQKIWQNDCCADLGSALDLLTCWLSISVLTQGFLAIEVTAIFAVYSFKNK